MTDTGIGIPPDKIGSLFTEFKQTDATIASEYGGTGLGLSISKKFVEMHGGRIWIESELGKGSAFIFEIPLAGRNSMSGKTILYVEDNEMNRKIVRDLLKRTTYQLIEAFDGEAGVAMALEKRPDLILMDIQLPKISGMEAMRPPARRRRDGEYPHHRHYFLRALAATSRRQRRPAPPPTSPSPTVRSTC